MIIPERGRGGGMTAWFFPDEYDYNDGYGDDEPARCELDHPDGGVCLRRLRRDGSCPDHPERAA